MDVKQLKQLKLSKSGEYIPIKFNPELPYLRIYFFEFLYEDMYNDFTSFKFSYKCYFNDKKTTQNDIYPQNSNYKSNVYVDQILELKDAINCEIKYESTDPNLANVTVIVKYDDLNRIETDNPKKEFKAHLGNTQNTKILFTAPFGQGKTTFLNYYFNEQKARYKVFNVCPVNYSIAQNEDIFRFIKADILLQLIEDPFFEFEKMEATYAETIPLFLKKNIHKLLSPFLLLVPLIGKDLFSVYEKLEGVSEKLFEFKDSNPAGIKDAISDFYEGIIQSGGSIYEDDFITRLIRQQIAKSKKESGKETVLIIDDLDRLDPEHTFRILNIISAHYDTYQGKVIEEANKFGFDKIILVCDLENIRHTFEHRYGPKVNFTGYINKFYSTAPFEYDNNKMLLNLLTELDDVTKGRSPNGAILQSIYLFLGPIIISNQLTLRDFLKLKNYSYEISISNMRKRIDRENINYTYGLFTPLIEMISKIYTKDTIIYKFTKCISESTFLNNSLMNEYSWHLISSIASPLGDNNYTYFFKNYEILISTENMSTDVDFKKASNIKVNEKGLNIVKEAIWFSNIDFYNLIIENIKKHFTVTNRKDYFN